MKRKSWAVFVDGKKINPETILLVSEYGELRYGKRPDGNFGWLFHEKGGGGAVILPYSIDPHMDLFVGLIYENRPNMYHPWCVPGGFIKPAESQHQEAGRREMAEELPNLPKNLPIKSLPGLPANSNRAFFITHEGEGIQSFAVEVPFQWLEMEPDTQTFKIKGLHKEESPLRFFPWRTAICYTPDAIARSTIAQLLAILF